MRYIVALVTGVSLWATTIYPIPIYIKEPMKILRLNIRDDQSKYQVLIRGDRGDNELLVFPKIFQSPKSLKILYKGEKPEVEKSYRIILQELLIEKDQQEGSMRIVKRFSIPLFVQPKTINPDLDYECTNEGIVIKNKGNVHFLINFMNNKKVHWYLYPNQSKEVEHVRSVHINTDKGEYNFTCKEAK